MLSTNLFQFRTVCPNVGIIQFSSSTIKIPVRTRPEMKRLLTLCTKNVQFTFDNQVYQQNDGVAMGSPSGPVLTGIFMVELENWIILTLGNTVLNWKRFVDNTIGYVKNGSINIILLKLNSFHPNIQFTYEIEKENKLSFFDILLIRNENFIETKVC